jgi:hypothetical protein
VVNTIGLVVWMYEETVAANVRELIVVDVGDVGYCVNKPMNWITDVTVTKKLRDVTKLRTV